MSTSHTSAVRPAVVGLVSAGEMGSALGAVLRSGGASVRTSILGRSPRTAQLARAAGLDLVDGLDEVLAGADVIVSVVPPQQARDTAADLIARAGRLRVRPCLADLNAISPAEVAAIETLTRAGGLDFVDGAISGAAPGREDGSTRILLSGAAAARVADLPWDGLAVSVVGTRAGAASAAKMCTGGVRKGLSALVINALVTAEANDVLEPVIAELERALRRDPVVDAELAASKAWRFAPEMDSVADTQEAAGVDPSTYRAIAEVFRRTARSSLAGTDPEHVHRGARTAAESAAAVAGLRASPGS